MSPLLILNFRGMKSKEEIKRILDTIIEGQGVFLVNLTLSPENVIEVYIDSMTGVNVATCREVCKQLEAQLDRESEDFELTVSSAGIGSPFKVPQQYEKNLNKAVEVKLSNGEKIQGILKTYSEKGISLEQEEKRTIEGTKKKETVKVNRNIDFTEIKEVKDIIIF